MALPDVGDLRIELLPPGGAGLGAPDGMRIPPLTLGRPERDTFRVTSVLSYGARGDGRTDDSGAISDAIADTPDGGVIYFPARTYAVNQVVILGRKCLTFVGDGTCSVLNMGVDFGFRGCDGITIYRLAFDAPGRTAQEGTTSLVSFAQTNNIRVSQCLFRDAAGEPVPDFGELQHAGIGVWRASETTSKFISITENRFERLGIRVEHARHVRIGWNVINKAAAHGIWVGGGWISREQPKHTDIEIVGNDVIDSHAYGIAVMDDSVPRGLSNRLVAPVMARIRVCGNSIRRSHDAGSIFPWVGIRIGVSTEEVDVVRPNADYGDIGAHDVVYRDIVVADNHVETASNDRRQEVGDIGIDFQLGVRDLDDRDPAFQHDVVRVPSFERPVVRNNTVIGFQRLGIRLMNIRFGAVHGNGLFECGSGLSIEHNVFQNHVFDNRVHHFGPAGDEQFALLDSLGQNLLNGNTKLREDMLAVWAGGGAGGGFWGGAPRVAEEAYTTDRVNIGPWRRA